MITAARKRYIKIWRFENPEKIRAQRNSWAKRNAERIAGYRLKRLLDKPFDSLFDVFLSLDVCTGYESKIMIDRITPLDELIMKEEGLL